MQINHFTVFSQAGVEVANQVFLPMMK